MSNQYHSGEGDNISGDKYIIFQQGIQSQGFSWVIDQIYYAILIQSYTYAKNGLDFLRNIDGKDIELNQIETSLSLFLRNKKNNAPLDLQDLDDIKMYISSSPTGIYRERHKAILIELLMLSDTDQAKTLIIEYKEENYSIELQRAYMAHCANETEITAYFTHKTNLNNIDNWTCVRAFVRAQNNKKALLTLKKIPYLASDFLTILETYLKIGLLELDIDQSKQYDFYSQSTIHKINECKNIFFTTINNKQQLSFWELLVLNRLLGITMLQEHDLLLVGIKFITQLQPINPQLTQLLKEYHTSINYTLSQEEIKILQNKLSNGETLSENESAQLPALFQLQKLSTKFLKIWFTKNGILNIESEFLKDTYLLLFKSYLFEDEKICLDFLIFFEKYLNKYNREDIKMLHPNTLEILTQNSLKFKIPPLTLVHELLEPLISIDNAYNYIYLHYLNYLLSLGKNESLAHHIERLMNDPEIPPEFMLVCARYFFTLGENDLSFELYEKTIPYYQGNLNVLQEYLSCLLKVQQPKKAKDIVNSLSDDYFQVESLQLESFISFVGINIDYTISIHLMVRFFLQNHEKFYAPFIKLFFNFITRPDFQTINENIHSFQFKNILYRIKYEYRDEIREGLIIGYDEIQFHPSFISIDSELGEEFVNTIQNNIIYLSNGKKYRLLEKEKNGVFSFLLGLARMMNNQKIEYPESVPMVTIDIDINSKDPLKNLLSFLEDNKPQTPELLTNSCTLYTKSYVLKKPDIECALDISTSPSFSSIINFNVGNAEANGAVLLDTYSFMYLVMNIDFSKVDPIKNKFSITKETHQIIENWLKDISRPDYLSIMYKNNGLSSINANCIDSIYPFLLSAKTLIQSIDVVNFDPYRLELSNEINKLIPFLSSNLISTIKASITLETPWFCLDEDLAFLLMGDPKIKITNLSSLHAELMRITNFKARKSSLYNYALLDLVITYTYSDLLELIRTEDIEDHKVLNIILAKSEFLEKADEYFKISFIRNLLQNILNSYLPLSKGEISKLILCHELITRCFDKILNGVNPALKEDMIVNIIPTEISDLGYSTIIYNLETYSKSTPLNTTAIHQKYIKSGKNFRKIFNEKTLEQALLLCFNAM